MRSWITHAKQRLFQAILDQIQQERAGELLRGGLETLEIAPRYWRHLQSHPQLTLCLIDQQERLWLPPTPLGRLDGGALTIHCDPELEQAACRGLPPLRLLLSG